MSIYCTEMKYELQQKQEKKICFSEQSHFGIFFSTWQKFNKTTGSHQEINYFLTKEKDFGLVQKS